MTTVSLASMLVSALTLAACAQPADPPAPTAGSATPMAPAPAPTLSSTPGSTLGAAGSAGSAVAAPGSGSAAPLADGAGATALILGGGGPDADHTAGLLVPGANALASGYGTPTGPGGLGPAGAGGHGMRTPTAAPVRVGTPTAQGDLDVEIIKRYIRRNLSKIAFCYERTLLAGPTPGGVVTATFYIDGVGNVPGATATGVRSDVAGCVASVIKSIEFPKPKGSTVRVVYPFTFALAP